MKTLPLLCAFSLAALAHDAAVFAQTYPVRPLRIITSDPGGAGDLVSRIIAPGLAASLGQQVVVDNRSGNVIIPAEILARSSPDGYTLIAYGGTLWLQPLMQNTPYDTLSKISRLLHSPRARRALSWCIHPSRR